MIREEDKTMEVPNNCWECPFTDVCAGPHYGGDECAFKEKIGGEQHE